MTFFVFEPELGSIISSLLQLTGYPIIILLYITMDFVNLQVLPPWSYSTFMMVIYYRKF